jgi:predicted RNA-binding Zn ribbon-like protein
MELAVRDAMWHGHAGIDKWIGLVWTESKIDQNKIASDVASKLNQRRHPGESVESWHKSLLRSTSSTSIGESRQFRTRLPSPSTLCSPA